ncbi:MAG: hypothetical protein LLF78_00075 [Synergistaceae bacterium]|nr:hypothetical protein [Synergistaceae bacterium]
MMNKIKEYIKEKLNKLNKTEGTTDNNVRFFRLKRFLLDIKGQPQLHTKLFLYSVSIIISVFIWAFVAWNGNTDGTRSMSVQIQYNNLPRGYSMFNKTRTVQLKLAGRINALSRLEPNDVTAQVDLQGLQIGKYSLPIKIDAPSHVRIRSWDPLTAEVEIYRHVERTIPITWKVDGEPPEGMVIASVDIKPAEAILSGPETDVLTVQAVNAVIPADKLKTSGQLRVPLKIFGVDEGRSDRFTLVPLYVNASVSLERETVGEMVPVKVSVIGEPADGFQIDSVTVVPDHVTISGRPTAVQKMQSLVLPPVDITGLDQDLQLMLPLRPGDIDPDLEITGPDRAKVEIRIRKKMAVKNYYNVGIMIEGNTPGKEWKISPESVNITIEGTQLALESLQGGNVPCELYIDVSNIVSRKVELPVLVKGLRKDFQVVKIEPEQVTVTALD